ncbi:lipoprotein [Methylobacterium sp. NEAU 140]|uniref:LPS translocon maturation chaperone LptM n=1 Tax=Methylobacterium sp. NEAU 140 TaxID=3064945 RepID=UPI0027331656|nr:lipoprotein [Methylobacterium sp. NEAU 140]MDP4021976.1 lipoprotein [Methylobacterium sp. NEAU 140]
MLPRPALTLLAASALAALAVSACGRRGALEPPQAAALGPAAGAQAAPGAVPGVVQGARTLPDSVGLGGGRPEPDPTAVRAGDELSLSAVPPAGTEAPIQTSRGAKRGYRIPRDPFILDPLL